MCIFIFINVTISKVMMTLISFEIKIDNQVNLRNLGKISYRDYINHFNHVNHFVLRNLCRVYEDYIDHIQGVFYQLS